VDPHLLGYNDTWDKVDGMLASCMSQAFREQTVDSEGNGSQFPTFRPQPWLALRTVAGTYHHDNLDIDEPFHRWRYVFAEETYPLGALDAIGLAANNAYGVTTVVIVDPATGDASRRVLNDPSAAVAAGHGS
jgi:hypothetical protein